MGFTGVTGLGFQEKGVGFGDEGVSLAAQGSAFRTRGRLGLLVLASRVCGFRAFTSLALKCGVCLIVGLGGSSRGQVFLMLGSKCRVEGLRLWVSEVLFGV